MITHISRGARAVGCLVGGAVGDALGAPIEFLDLAEIRRQFGTRGILDLETGNSGLAPVTSDTQMTLFSAEGLLELRGRNRALESSSKSGGGPVQEMSVQPVLEAYHRWLMTQGAHPRTGPGTIYAGMSEDEIAQVLSGGTLVHLPRLHARRSPGDTALTSLETGEFTSPADPQNNINGSGAAVRVAPAGIIAANPVTAFRLGGRLAALTHGHPTAYTAAASLALLIHHIIEGEEPVAAVSHCVAGIRRYRVDPRMSGAAQAGPNPDEESVADAIERAVKLALSDAAACPETIEGLGAGWDAEEALAIGIYAALVYPDDLPAAVRLAVNHSGDSNSTGAICGSIVGSRVGFSGIPGALCEHLELKRELRRLAIGLNDAHGLVIA